VVHKKDAIDRWTIVARRAENIIIEDSSIAPMEAETAASVAEARILQAETAAKAAEARILEAEAAAKAAESAHASAMAQIAALHASTSWRLTKPLRAVSMLMRGQANPKSVIDGSRS
jgi:hypothetical protein